MGLLILQKIGIDFLPHLAYNETVVYNFFNPISHSMSSSPAVLARPTTASQSKALIAFMQAMHINFDVQEPTPAYDAEFVKRVLDSKKQIPSGKTKRINKEELTSLLGV